MAVLDTFFRSFWRNDDETCLAHAEGEKWTETDSHSTDKLIGRHTNTHTHTYIHK